MAKKPTRLHFSEDDLADSKVRKAAAHAEKAADKAERATDKLGSKKKVAKLKLERECFCFRKTKLAF